MRLQLGQGELSETAPNIIPREQVETYQPQPNRDPARVVTTGRGLLAVP